MGRCNYKAAQRTKGIENTELRDHMSEAELIFTALAELSTRQIAEATEATGMEENTTAAKAGGNIAKKTRIDLEEKTQKKVISSESYLPIPKKISKDPYDNE